MDDQSVREMLDEICESKAEELRLLGYDTVTRAEIWDCVNAKYKETPALHQLVNDILSLRSTYLMHWLTMRAWKNTDKPTF